MHDSWRPFLTQEFSKPYFKELSSFLHHAYQVSIIFPKKSQVFRCFFIDLNSVKVVILGQDPYHTPGMATGLAFSVPKNSKLPPSLKNIYQEIDNDLGSHHNLTGDLSSWANQGVFLLNNVLTVEAGLAGSHRGHGWEEFTIAVIRYLNTHHPHLVFILWGRDARNKKPLITGDHLILESAHPSPLSAYHGFFGSKPFSKTNNYLVTHGKMPIVW